MHRIPEIDIEPLKNTDISAQERTIDQLGEAAKTTGFFYLKNHGISQDQIDATYRAAKDFFAQPQTYKLTYYIGHNRTHRGYVPFTEKGQYADEVSRNYEAYDIGAERPFGDQNGLGENLLSGPNIWPDLGGFKTTVQDYYAAVSSLGITLCTAFERYLGLADGAMTQHMNAPISQLRLLHYLHDNRVGGQKTVNMGAHTDYECLTLLHTKNPGLQILTQDEKWIDIPVIPDALVVNIGDMLEAWSNGIFRATPHRVINKQPERFSMAYFVAPDYDTRIRPFPNLCGEQDKILDHYDFIAGHHLENMLLRDFPYLRNRHSVRRTHSASNDYADHSNPFEKVMNKHRL